METLTRPTVRTGEAVHVGVQTVHGEPPEGDAEWALWRVAQQTTMFTDMKRAQVLRKILRLCRHEGIVLRHGTVKHFRDLIRNLEHGDV